MEVRLVQLLASFIRVSAEYALARLEYALHHPSAQAPPIIDRLPDASEQTLHSHWPHAERQLDAALRYYRTRSAKPGTRAEDKSDAWLRRTVQELDQYARAIRWVLTVEER